MKVTCSQVLLLCFTYNTKSDESNIVQVDGNISVSTASDDDQSVYATQDEAFPSITPLKLSPIPDQNILIGQPLQFDVNQFLLF